jgi:glycosyltransferase involved in cell wall biosynthesis
MKYSVILPTFGRPDEVTNFLESMTSQKLKDFEVVVVDGSLNDVLHPVIEKYKPFIDLQYFHEKGLGASESRKPWLRKIKRRIRCFHRF